MEGLSNHTRLLNIIMGLALKIPNWPHPLRDLDYNLELIEANLPEANPDLILTTKKYNHSIVVDCKSKTIKEEQIERYINIRSNPSLLTKRGFVDVPVPQHYSADPTFVSFNDLSNNSLIVDNKIPLLHVIESNNEIHTIERKISVFQMDRLNDVFPIDIRGMKPPYNLYPFDVQDKEIFTIHILRELLDLGIHQISFSEEELLKRAHKYWSIISEHKKREFRTIAGRILYELGRSELKEYLKKDGAKWNIILKKDVKSIQAFQKRCEDAIKSLQSKLKQSTLEAINNEAN